ncbi:protein turtle isoform X3 [Tetranychus urticae]|uniref:protein turtle isoform X3 n=1 Tax=Tetranychus urticae TaxID=32264 RepID=UPI00077B895E|nr:protein turtle isoform X3 [Tetranychus urticae]
MIKPFTHWITLIIVYFIFPEKTGSTSQPEPERVTANVGENVILNCAFDYPEGIPVSYVIQWQKLGIDLPIYIWYDGYPPHTGTGYEGRASLSGQASLNLTKVNEEDQGWYECKVFFLNRPPTLPKNGSWVHLDVHAPPHFKVKPPDVVYVKVGEFLSLPCEAAGTPAPTLIWYKDNSPLEASSSIEILANELRISSLKQSDIGDYLCMARNREGSVTTTAKVIVAGSAVITVPPRNLTKLEGDKAEFTCEAKALPSNVTYQWFHNNVDISELSWLDTRTIIKRDGTLLINPTSAEDSGQYTCKVFNGIGSPETAFAYLTVEYPARVTYSPTIQYLPLGLSGIVRCFVQANPPFQFITWTKDRRPFEPNNLPGVVSLNNGSLLFQRVTNEHQGRYRCTPYNIHGTAGTSNVMEVLVREPPLFTLKPKEAYQQSVNSEVKMPCEGVGQPKPTISWRKADGSKLPKERAFIRGGNLTLKSIKKEDHGRYECVLENEIATLVTSSLLNVDSTTPHAPTNVSVNTSAFAATITWQPSYDGGYEQTYVIWYRMVDTGDTNWKTIRVYPEGSTTFTLYYLQPDTEYEFQVYSRNILGEGLPSLVVKAKTKVLDVTNSQGMPTDGYGSTYIPSVFKSTGPKPGPPRNVTVTRVAQGHAISWLSPANKTVPVAYYYIEYKIGSGSGAGAWKIWGPIAKETSYLVKTFKPGDVYTIRVFAHSILGAGQPSEEIRYEVPGGNFRHSKDKAIAAGVVGGILFFIAAIVLSVCTVKICNERKRRKAEKAYLMVTCPIMNVANGQSSQAGSPMPLKSYEESRVPSLVNSSISAILQKNFGNPSSSSEIVLQRFSTPTTATLSFNGLPYYFGLNSSKPKIILNITNWLTWETRKSLPFKISI